MAETQNQSVVARDLAFLSLCVCVFACGGTSHERPPEAPASVVGSAIAFNAADTPLPASTAEPVVPEHRRPVAPGFDGATAWLNAERALTLDDLRGHIVLVDFWTSCCINCLHTLPTLAELERAFSPNQFLVLGVHSPKFETERRSERLESIAQQYGIRHPIAVDGNMAIWDRWGATSWPTLVLLDARGRIAWVGHGEPDVDELRHLIEGEIARADSVERSLVNAPVAGARPADWNAPAIGFPSGIAVVDGRTLAVTDTGNGRVLLVGRDGRVTQSLGDGQFAIPHGLSSHNGYIYVADTDHHQVKRIRLTTREVEVVAGTGELGFAPLRDQWRRAREVALRSPWATTWVGERLFVALAGSHQIAEIDVPDGRIRGFAGNGREALEDGERMDASFAQPSALASDGTELFVLDSESSSVRAVHLRTSAVRTIVGRGLFESGLIDGDARTARLQHPLGLAYAEGALWVADTYNNAIRRVDPTTGATTTRFRSAAHEELYEPAAIVADRDALWIADTNHHRMALVRTGSGAPRAVEFRDGPAASRAVVVPSSTATPARTLPRVELEAVPVAPDRTAVLRIEFAPPQGTIVNEEAPFSLTLRRAERAQVSDVPISRLGSEVRTGVTVHVQLARGSDNGLVELDLSIVVCDDVTHAACVPVDRTLSVPLRSDGAAAADARRSLVLPSAVVP